MRTTAPAGTDEGAQIEFAARGEVAAATAGVGHQALDERDGIERPATGTPPKRSGRARRPFSTQVRDHVFDAV